MTRPGTRIWASSEGRGWRSVFVTSQHQAPFDTYCRPVADHLICVHLSGPVRITCTLEGKRECRLVVPGSASIMPGDTDFGLRLEAPLETVHFYLHRAVVDELASEFARNSDSVRLVPQLGVVDPFLEQIAMALREQLGDARMASALYVDHLARAAAARLLHDHSTAAAIRAPPAGRLSGLTRERLRRAIDYIEANLDKDMTLPELAAVGCLSPIYFARQFKRATGLAPYQYFMRARIARAKRLLSTGDLPIAAVAFDCGFCHQEHLTRVFRRHCGMTPGAYRAANKGLMLGFVQDIVPDRAGRR